LAGSQALKGQKPARLKELPENETDMVRWNSAIPLVILVALAAIVASPPESRAGESLSEHDEFDNGPSFFGEAKEAGSLKSIQNVQVKAELGARKMLANTNADGQFKLPSFGKQTAVENVIVSCAKEGYRTIDVSRRRMSSAADAPVQIECLLEPKQ
jgi:hypothetical protein